MTPALDGILVLIGIATVISALCHLVIKRRAFATGLAFLLISSALLAAIWQRVDLQSLPGILAIVTMLIMVIIPIYLIDLLFARKRASQAANSIPDKHATPPTSKTVIEADSGEKRGFFDKMAESAFITSPEGETVFFPNGLCCKGRLVPDEQTKQKLLKEHKRMLKATYFVIGLYMPFIAFVINMIDMMTLLPVAIYVVYTYFRQRSLTKDLQMHSMKLSFREAMERNSVNFPDWYYWVGALVSLNMIVLGVFLPAICNKPFSEFLIPVFVFIALGLLGLAIAANGYKQKKRSLGTGASG